MLEIVIGYNAKNRLLFHAPAKENKKIKNKKVKSKKVKKKIKNEK